MLVQARYENKKQRASQQGASWPAGLPPVLKDTQNPGAQVLFTILFACLFNKYLLSTCCVLGIQKEAELAWSLPPSVLGELPTPTGSAGNSSNSMQLWGCQLRRRGG